MLGNAGDHALLASAANAELAGIIHIDPGIEQDLEDRPSATEPPANELGVSISASTSRRTSQGRQKRVIDASIPREKILHPLDEKNVPPELLKDPRAKRFFRFVREEVELQERSLSLGSVDL